MIEIDTANMPGDSPELPQTMEELRGEQTQALQVYAPLAVEKPEMDAHIAALHIQPGQSKLEIVKKVAMLTTYTGAPSVLIDAYINVPLEVLGCMYLDVPEQARKIDRQTGQVREGHDAYQLVLFKVRDPETGKLLIIRSSASQAINLAKTILLPGLGWFDWELPVKMLVRLNGKAQRIQFLDGLI
jgi:hypothetical protein